MKCIIVIITLIFYFNLLCGQKCTYMNFVILIDEEIKCVYDGVLLFNSSVNSQIDSIYWTCTVGTINFEEEDYAKFLSINAGRQVTIKFKYRHPEKDYGEYEYEYIMDADFLKKGFVILKIYNFWNKKNWKSFWQREGYGIEYQADHSFNILPRRKNRKRL